MGSRRQYMNFFNVSRSPFTQTQELTRTFVLWPVEYLNFFQVFEGGGGAQGAPSWVAWKALRGQKAAAAAPAPGGNPNGSRAGRRG